MHQNMSENKIPFNEMMIYRAYECGVQPVHRSDARIIKKGYVNL